MIEQYLRDYLRDSAAVSDRVDQGSEYPGVYAGNVPQGHRGECIVLQAIIADHNYHLGGEVADRETIVQITTYSDNAARAYTLMELVRNRLSGYVGNLGDSDETLVKTCVIINDVGAGVETPADASDRWRHSYTCDYDIIHTTPVPTLT